MTGSNTANSGRLKNGSARRSYRDDMLACAGILLLAGLFVALLGATVFASLRESVVESDTARFDLAVLLWLRAFGNPWLDRVAVHVTALGDTLVVVSVALVAGSLLWLLRRRALACLLAIAVGGACVISLVLKAIFDRPRHDLLGPAPLPLDFSPAYPSGHATLSLVVLAVLAFIIHRIAERRRIRVAAIVVASAGTALIGLSRMYLGLHHPSDVMAGYVVGLAWVVHCLWLMAPFQPVPRPHPRTGTTTPGILVD